VDAGFDDMPDLDFMEFGIRLLAVLDHIPQGVGEVFPK
jgi:hypothetical protein